MLRIHEDVVNGRSLGEAFAAEEKHLGKLTTAMVLGRGAERQAPRKPDEAGRFERGAGPAEAQGHVGHDLPGCDGRSSSS